MAVFDIRYETKLNVIGCKFFNVCLHWFSPIDNSLTAGALAAHHHTTDEAKCWTFHLKKDKIHFLNKLSYLPGGWSTDIVGTGELRGEVHQVRVVPGQRDQTSSYGLFLLRSIVRF